MGLLNEVTQVISRQLNVNIRKLTIRNQRWHLRRKDTIVGT